MAEKIPEEYLEMVDAKYVQAKLEEKVKSTKVLEEARGKHFKIACPDQPIKKWSTYYEEVKEVGFYPQERRLEAVLDIKQPYGYGGGLGSIGSYEYVGLYVNWNGDGDYNDTGEDVGVANVHVFDPCNVNAKKLPIHYAVYRDVTPLPTLRPGTVIRVMALLSWQVPPTGPNFVPIWGNRIERWIRIDPIE